MLSAFLKLFTGMWLRPMVAFELRGFSSSPEWLDGESLWEPYQTLMQSYCGWLESSFLFWETKGVCTIHVGHTDKEGMSEEHQKFKGKGVDLHW